MVDSGTTNQIVEMQSQARQDDFVVSVLGEKKGGWWLELGGNHPAQARGHSRS